MYSNLISNHFTERFTATTQASVKWPWQGSQIWSAQRNTSFLCAEGGSAWASREAHWNQGPVPIFAPHLCLKYKEACAWRRFKSQRLFSAPANSFATVGCFITQQWAIKESASIKRVWAAGPTLPLSNTSHFNAGAIWESLYKAVVNDWSLFHSPDKRAGPWGWLWWCAVA